MDVPPTPSTPAIEARGLVKRFGETTALAGLDLSVPQGGCFGLLGPNGAGKTTTLHILTTLARPDAGEALLLGRDVVEERSAVRRDVGIVFQESTLDPELTPREHLELYARLYHLAEPRTRVAEMLELVGLTDSAERPVRQLSGGMRRRLEIARGILHAPRVLFLDEPTLGLDVAARRTIWEYLRALREREGTTVFLTTHYLEEADALCERVAILDRGRVVACDAPEALKAALGGDVVRIALARAGKARERLASVAGVREAVLEESDADEAPTLRITVTDGPQRLATLLDAVREFEVLEVTLRRPSLEHVFLHHTGHPFEILE